MCVAVDLENLSSDNVVLTSVAASVGGAGAAGDLCAPPAAAMSPDNNHNHQPLADGTSRQTEDQNCLIVSSPDEGESGRIFVGRDAGSAGLQGLLMVKVRKDAEGQNEVEVLGDESEVISTDEVPRRRQMLRRGLLGEEEEKILQEYMQRSDTAVIFPEPVEQGTWLVTHCREALWIEFSVSKISYETEVMCLFPQMCFVILAAIFVRCNTCGLLGAVIFGVILHFVL